MSTAYASSPPSLTLSDPNEQFITENIEVENILTENRLAEFITEEIYLEELILAEDIIAELLLEEDVIDVGFSKIPLSDNRGFPKPKCPNSGGCQKLQLSEITGTF